MPNILLLGGTGIVGKATIQKGLENGWDMTTVSLQADGAIPKQVQQIVVDKTRPQEYKEKIEKLNAQQKQWDVVFDIASYSGEDAKQTYKCVKDHAKYIVILSTTLVYDRSNPTDTPIKSSHPLTKPGELGGYVDHKLALETFWQSVTDCAWTLFRPYHIVGPHSLLGCIPDHNRDPKLFDRLQSGEALALCAGGETALNYIHPSDIAEAVLRVSSAHNGRAYNLVNPTKILAREYYEEIAKQLGVPLKIKQKSVQQIWKEAHGWELTTLPHLYDMTNFQADFGFLPSTPLTTAIRDAIAYYPQNVSEPTPIHEHMTQLPRPKRIEWLMS